MLLALLLALSFPSAAADTLPGLPAGAEASAYLDADARETVRLSRERRAGTDLAIDAYQALARERISVGLRAMRRDRVLFRREIAARVHWRREGVGRIELLGARQVVPIAAPRASVPDGLRRVATSLPFDPARLQILQGLGDDDFFRHPLAPGSEADYRFRSGDTTRVRLSAGRVLRLLELQVIPRRAEARLLRGSFWMDADTHAPVRATFRLARPVDVERDLGEEDEDIPRLLRPLRGEVRYVTIEYGLWDQRWWLPRLIALEVRVRAGSLLEVPVVYERSYTDYLVSAAGHPAELAASRSDSPPAAGDTLRSCERDSCSRYVVEVHGDDDALLASELLPPSVYAEGEALITEGELREIASVLGVASPGASGWQRPEVRLSYLTPDLLRYDRVRGLAVGARADADAGPVAADATLWLETAGPDLSGELGVERSGYRARQRIAAYRRLAAVDPDPRALGLGSSLAALLLGRDESDYYRTLGVELTGEPVAARAVDYRWRLFAERQETAPARTDFSLPRLFDADRGLGPGIEIDPAEQLGGALEVRVARGLDPLGVRWGAEAAVGAEVGSYRLVRPSLALRAGFPLPLRLVGSMEVAGGTILGEAPLQRQWFLGGPATVRGYGSGSRIHGDTYWRSRVEVGTALPAARLVAFSDAGWAGERSEFSADPPLLSAGVGASFLDGLVRLDLARALRGGGWRLDLHLDAGM